MDRAGVEPTGFRRTTDLQSALAPYKSTYPSTLSSGGSNYFTSRHEAGVSPFLLERTELMAPEEGIEPSTNGLTVRCTTAVLLWNMVPATGFEPMTYRLSSGCSTTELRRNLVAGTGIEPATFGL